MQTYQCFVWVIFLPGRVIYFIFVLKSQKNMSNKNSSKDKLEQSHKNSEAELKEFIQKKKIQNKALKKIIDRINSKKNNNT